MDLGGVRGGEYVERVVRGNCHQNITDIWKKEHIDQQGIYAFLERVNIMSHLDICETQAFVCFSNCGIK